MLRSPWMQLALLFQQRLQCRPNRVEHLLLRHEELKRTNALLQQQLSTVIGERDSLRSRLGAVRSRIDALLERLPADGDTEGTLR